jgi:hypothetical protein
MAASASVMAWNRLGDSRSNSATNTPSRDVLSDTELWHVYTIANGLIERMDIEEGGGEGPSAAFSANTHMK